MNNSFARLIDGMTATLRQEVLTRLDDDFARGQVFGVINLLNTFKSRADWSTAFLSDQAGAQEAALAGVEGAVKALPPSLPPPPNGIDENAGGDVADVERLLSRRDANNRAIAAWLAWLESVRGSVPADVASTIEAHLRRAMRAEVDLELRHSPRPLFAEMSSGREA